ncbi:MAG TPA: glycosyltransferase, partial [Gillisia sp.]|nr:glycosyltransferase [Gillisia sp.]
MTENRDHSLPDYEYEIAAVVINFNSSSYTIDCVNSLLEKTGSSVSLQIVIVDNASQYEDYCKLKAFHSGLGDNILLVRSRINTGFGGGN